MLRTRHGAPQSLTTSAAYVAHLVVHGTSGSTSYETIPHARLESSGGVLSTVDIVVQRRDGPRRLRDRDDDDDDDDDDIHGERPSSTMQPAHEGLCNTVRPYTSVCLSVPAIDYRSSVRRVCCCGSGGQKDRSIAARPAPGSNDATATAARRL